MVGGAAGTSYAGSAGQTNLQAAGASAADEAGSSADSGGAGASGGQSGATRGEAGAVTGDAGAATCNAGEVGCDGLTPTSCQSGLLKASGPACAYGCNKGACTGECAAGDGQCVGQSFERCGTDNHWQSGSACKYVCDPTDGCVGTCTPGTLKCNTKSELDICSAKGELEKSETCDLECDVVSGKAECVECTSGDSLCVGGCTPVEDSDCPAEVGSSSCPNIYLGIGRYKSPQPKDFANAAVGSPAMLTVGEAILLAVEVNNHGDNSPPVQVELFWGDPSDGCQAKTGREIGDASFASGIPGASAAPPAEGISDTHVSWVPSAAALSTNGGKVCILARLHDLTAPQQLGCTQQSYNSTSPASDPLSAVHEVQLVAAQ